MKGSSITVAELAREIGLEYRGDGSLPLSGVAGLDTAVADELSFLASNRYRDSLQYTRAGAVILSPELADECPTACLLSTHPHLSYARASGLFSRAPEAAPGVAPGAVVAESAVVPASVAIGANAVIGEHVVLGEDTVIGAGCVIGAGARLGRGCRLHANVTLYHDVALGDEVTLHSAVVIGGDGFGFAPQQGSWVKIHQLGGVRIGDRVEIGAGSTVDRGTIEDTVIGDDVIIDNLVMVAHNVHIGDGTAIAGCTGIAGSTHIGRQCTIAGGAGIVGHITIADNVHVTGDCRVTKSITEPGAYASGTPFMEASRWRRNAVRFTQLDELASRIASLEKQLKAADKDKHGK